MDSGRQTKLNKTEREYMDLVEDSEDSQECSSSGLEDPFYLPCVGTSRNLTKEFFKILNESSASTSGTHIPNEQPDTSVVFEFNGPVHPLLIPTVLCNIFKHLDVESLKNSRRVNTVWNIEACRVMRIVCPVTFIHNNAISTYLSTFINSNENQPHPHCIYQFYRIEFNEFNVILNNFLEMFGSHIKTLNLQLLNRIPFTMLQKVVLRNTPNLESLWLRSLPFMNESSKPKKKKLKLKRRKKCKRPSKMSVMLSSGSSCTSSSSIECCINDYLYSSSFVEKVSDQEQGQDSDIEQIEQLVQDPDMEQVEPPQVQVSGLAQVESRVRHLTIGTHDLKTILLKPGEPIDGKIQRIIILLGLFPNLESIVISGLDETINIKHIRTLTKGIIGMPALSLVRLNTLQFPILLNDIVLSGLINLRSTYLNDLEIILYEPVTANNLSRFFTMIGHSLNKLSVTIAKSYHYSFNSNRLLGQNFSSLNELTLRRFHNNLSFLEFMPILNKLILIDVDIAENFPVRLKVMPYLQCFKNIVENENFSQRMDSEVISRVARAFPKLTELHFMGATNGCLRVVYMDFPHLTVLECTKGVFTDSGITGISPEVCINLKETMEYNLFNGDKLRKNLFIGNLTKIRRLKLESNNICEISIIFGTNKCLQLEHLYLKSSYLTDFSMKKIAECIAHSLISLNVNECENVTLFGTLNLKKKMIPRNFITDPWRNLTEMAIETGALHRKFDSGPQRNERNQEQEPSSSLYLLSADNMNFTTRPFPREHAHRPVFLLNDYAEKEEPVLMLPIRAAGLPLGVLHDEQVVVDPPVVLGNEDANNNQGNVDAELNVFDGIDGVGLHFFNLF